MAGFFQNGSSLDLIGVEELLLYRYANIEYIMNLEINEGILFINKAEEEKEREKNWKMWLARFQWMDKDNFISFEEYNESLTGKNIDTRSKEDILNMAREIEEKARQKRGG